MIAICIVDWCVAAGAWEAFWWTSAIAAVCGLTYCLAMVMQ